jgi:hypothetical protein
LKNTGHPPSLQLWHARTHAPHAPITAGHRPALCLQCCNAVTL